MVLKGLERAQYETPGAAEYARCREYWTLMIGLWEAGYSGGRRGHGVVGAGMNTASVVKVIMGWWQGYLLPVRRWSSKRV